MTSTDVEPRSALIAEAIAKVEALTRSERNILFQIYPRYTYKGESNEDLDPNIIKSPYPDLKLVESDLYSYMKQHWEKHGDKLALIGGSCGQRKTYKELIADIETSRNNLHARGFRKGDTLMLYTSNSIEFVIVYYAVMSLGGVVTTCSPAYTATEVAHQLHDSGATYAAVEIPGLARVLKGNQLKGALHTVWAIPMEGAPDIPDGLEKGEVNELLPFSNLLEANAVNPPAVSINPSDIAIVPYSSGTTGLSKGVMLTHQNLVANIQQMFHPETKLIKPDDVVMCFLPMYHIFGQTVVLNSSLWMGCTVVVMPRFTPVDFCQLIQTHKISVVYIVPPVVLLLAKHPLALKFDLSSVRTIMSGAAPLGNDVAQLFRQRFPNVDVRQGFGMTETSPGVCISPENNTKFATCGFLVPNCIAKIADASTGKALPIGSRGELCVKGPNIMKGYLNNPAATATSIDKDGWLHTGDIAVLDEDGHISIVDRLKELIKYKGFQVPPAELEAILIGHDKIADAAVIGIQDPAGQGELPKAYVVLQAGQKISQEEIQEFLKEKVAHYKRLRGGVEFVGTIPKSAAGKILRRQLKMKHFVSAVMQRQSQKSVAMAFEMAVGDKSLAAKLSQEKKDKLRKQFDKFDLDGNGSIDVQELTTLLNNVGQFQNDKQAMAMMAVHGKDGEIDFEHFTVMMAHKMDQDKGKTELQQAFRLFDEDGDGEISLVEVKKVVQMTNQGLSDKEIECMVREADTNGDGVINFQEFKDMMTR